MSFECKALTAWAQMLTALVDLLNAGERGHDLPWGTVKDAVFAGCGIPITGVRFEVVRGGVFVTSRGLTSPSSSARPGTSLGDGYDASRRVVVLPTSETEVEIARSLDELRLMFRPVTKGR